MTGSTPPALGTFSQRVRVALADDGLQQAMNRAKGGFVDKRRDAVAALPEFDQIRDASKDIKDHVLAHLDLYLEMYEQKVLANGGHVHWARTGDEASRLITQLCEGAGARRVTKGKSMVLSFNVPAKPTPGNEVVVGLWGLHRRPVTENY